MSAPLGVAALLLGLALGYWAIVNLGLFAKKAA
jgi:hypothetical protein